MTTEQLAYEIARGLINTGVEGAYDSVSCSTAGDYPSIGVSQWEGNRANTLLGMIPDGDYYANRGYNDIVNHDDDLNGLKIKLNSPEGQDAQLKMLSKDCETYVNTLYEVSSLDDSRCMIYAGIWCPTSHYVVKKFLQNREMRGYDLRNLKLLKDLFYEQYTDAAGVGERYRLGYQNRAINTYNYVASLDLTTPYGVPVYQEI